MGKNERECPVLVVDDTLLHRLTLSNLLVSAGMQVDTASGGRECIRKAAFNYYDIVFLDDFMPDLTGGETLQRLREQDILLESTKVVALTAITWEGIEKSYLNAGFDGFLEKPVTPEALYRLLVKLR